MALCDAGNSQLVIIDVQEKLAATIAPQVLDRMVTGCALLLDAALSLEVPAILTEQYPQGLGTTIAAIASHLPAGVHAIDKTCFSCAGADDFRRAIGTEGRNQVVLAGMESHVCVLQTAMELREQGREVFVVEDAVCARSELNHRNALTRLREAGVVISNVESVIFEWLRDARHAHFRQISALLKARVHER